LAPPPGQRRGDPPSGASLRTPLLLATVLAAAGAFTGWVALRAPDQAVAPPLTVIPEKAAAAMAPPSAVIPPPRLIEPFRDQPGDAPAADEDPPPAPDHGGLTRADVEGGIDVLREAIDRCPREPPRIGVVRLTVASSGKVAAVQLSGGLAGNSAGECVANIARGAVFRPSPRERTVISWPLALGRPPTTAARDVPETEPEPGSTP